MMIRALLLMAVVGGGVGCVGDAGPHGQGAQEPERVGKIALSLTGTDGSGRQYRLRDAQFLVSPYYYDPNMPEPVTLSSETDPNAEFLEARLLAGYYLVSLINGPWYLERLTATGPERVEQAVLLSEPSVQVYVYPMSTTDAYFGFGVDGDLVDFRGGTLRIGILVQSADDDAGI